MLSDFEEKNKVFDGIGWNNLSYEFDAVDAIILKKIYLPKSEVVCFDVLFKKINQKRNRSLLCKTNLRRRLKNYNENHLIILINTKPLIINPIITIENNIKKLIKILSIKHELEKIE